jgi:hypothetical protein
MGVAPEAIVKFLFEYRLKVSLSASRIFDLRKNIFFFLMTGFLSGARPALPMGVAPEAMMGCLQPIIDSNKSGLFFYFISHPFLIIFMINFLTRQFGALVGLTFICLSWYWASSLTLLAQIPSCLIIKKELCLFYNSSPLLLGSAAASSSSLCI